MNFIDQLHVDSLLATLGHAPYGAPGYGFAFGSLPQFTAFPPGSSMFSSGTFFGPQVYSPHHLSFGQSVLGQGAGLALESVAARYGQFYAPYGVGLMDVMRGRAMERDIMGVSAIGRAFDEQSLALAVERGFRLALGGTTTPESMAHAQATASAFMPLASAIGLSRSLPGGSAEDFSKYMFMASQLMRRDAQSFGLGLPVQDTETMTRQLLTFFAPVPGQIDMLQTRGLPLQDIGKMAATLTSYGLLKSDVGQENIDQVARQLGLNVQQLTSGEMRRLRDVARASNIGEQLKAYADVIGTMREIMGSADAPIPTILDQLQRITGGSMQTMTPERIRNMLNELRETARASSVTMDTMMLLAQSGADLARQMGSSGKLGAQFAMSGALSTVAGQTLVTGPFTGRMDPSRMQNLQFMASMRGALSPDVALNVNLLSMLEEGAAMHPPGTEALVQSLMEQARAGAFGVDTMVSSGLLENLAQLGFDPNQARRRLRSAHNVQRELERRPELRNIISRRQIGEIERTIGGFLSSMFGRGALQALETGQGDRVSMQLANAARDSNMDVDAILQHIANAYTNTATGATSEMEAYLRDRGVNTSRMNLAEIVNQADASAAMRQVFAGASVNNREELAQLYSRPRQAAAEASQRRVAEGVAGQNLLADVNAQFRGGALSRLMGAISAGETTAGGAALRAFGFVPGGEFLKSMDDAFVRQVSAMTTRLNATTDPAQRQEIQQQLRDLVNSRHSLAALAEGGALAGIANTRGTSAVLEAIGDANMGRVIRAVASNGPEDQRLAALRHLVRRAGGIERGTLENIAEQLPADERERFMPFVNLLPVEAQSFQERLRQYDAATPEERRRMLPGMLSGAADFASMVGALRAQAPLLNRRFALTQEGKRSLADNVSLMNEYRRTYEELLRDPSGPGAAAAMAALHATGAELDRAWFKDGVDEQGKPIRVVNEEMIMQAVSLSRTEGETSESMTKRADSLRNALSLVFGHGQVIGDARFIVQFDPEQTMDAVKMLRKYGTFEGDILPLKSPRLFTPLERMGMEAGLGAEGAMFQRLRGVRGILDTPMRTPEASEAVARALGRFFSTTGKSLFKGGSISPEVESLIWGLYTDQSGQIDYTGAVAMQSMLMQAGEFAGLSEEDRTSKIKNLLEENAARRKAEHADIAGGTGTSAAAGGGAAIKIKFVNAAGQEISDQITVTVRDETPSDGREAAKASQYGMDMSGH